MSDPTVNGVSAGFDPAVTAATLRQRAESYRDVAGRLGHATQTLIKEAAHRGADPASINAASTKAWLPVIKLEATATALLEMAAALTGDEPPPALTDAETMLAETLAAMGKSPR
jgi:hypothetical protein